ncbi:MAG: putative lipoprotein [Ilumatobacteraceae bacterium]|nr:putative lipoprotein [Ilumatobacteraceae bacterium]
MTTEDDDTRQSSFTYRFDWGLDGLRALAPFADFVVVVDVLRFSTAVTAALESGSVVLPYPWDSADAAAFAADRGAVLASDRSAGGPSLSPTDLLTQAADRRIVLPSPNGATLAFTAARLGPARVLAGCLRNASAVAARVRGLGGSAATVAVIGAGERWGTHTGPLRPAVEDNLGAGAILAALDPSGAVGGPRCSPEARAARAAFLDARPRLYDSLLASASGHDLARRGWHDDIATSAAHDVTDVVGELVGDTFVPMP